MRLFKADDLLSSELANSADSNLYKTIIVPKTIKVRNYYFSVEKLHDFNANSSGSFPNILSSAKIGELYLLGTSDALLLLTPSGDIKTLWQDCPVYKIVSNEHFVFFIRGVEREFGFMRIESIRKNFAKINKGTALFNPLGPVSKMSQSVTLIQFNHFTACLS